VDRRTVVISVGIVGAVLLAACGGGTPAAVHPPSTTSTTPSSTTTSSSAPATTTSTTTAATANCTSAQLGVTAGPPAAGLGHEGGALIFTNTSASPCTLSGYPGVAGLDATGNQAVQAQRTAAGYLGGFHSGGPLPSVVLTAGGGSASAYVEGTDNPVGTATSCPTYPALLVTPPNALQSVRVGLAIPGCSPIQVHPVVPGLTGQAT
jgi:Protein of unknown function (DUF4232)